MTVDLGRFDSRIEALVSRLLEREFRADGPLSINIGRTIDVSAGDVYLASAGWDDAEPMLVARRMEATIRTASLLKGPIRFERIEIEGLRLRLVSNDAGDVNWDLGIGEKSGKGDAGRRAVEPPVVIERIDIRDSAAALVTPGTTVEVMIQAIEHAARNERLVTRISGSVNDVRQVIPRSVLPIVEEENPGFHIGPVFDQFPNDKPFPTTGHDIHTAVIISL